MISQEAWKQIADAGFKRAQLINDFCKVGYTPISDQYVTDAHTLWSQNLIDNYPELQEYSLQTVKDMVAQCSEEYIIDKSLMS